MRNAECIYDIICLQKCLCLFKQIIYLSVEILLNSGVLTCCTQLFLLVLHPGEKEMFHILTILGEDAIIYILLIMLEVNCDLLISVRDEISEIYAPF